MKRFTLMVALIAMAALSVPVFAQPVAGAVQIVQLHFFAALVAGIILAVSFQLFLTNFSGAVGLSAGRMFTHPKSKRKDREDREEPEGRISDQVYSALRKISAGYGIMTLVTASISLFLATWLAAQIAAPITLTYAVILALSIWGFSYILTLSLEVTASATMVGAIGRVAKQTVQSISESTYQMIGRSEAKKDADRAREITQAVRDELFGGMDIRRQLTDYFRELKPEYSPRDYRKELEDLLNSLHIEEYVSPDRGPGGIQEVIREIRTSGSPMDQDRARNATGRLREAAARARQEYQSDRRASEKVVMGAMRMAGMSPEEAEDSRRKIEGFLRSTDKRELEPEGIKQDLEKLFQDPSRGTEALKNRLAAIDRDTIETILSKRQDMSKEEVHQKVDRIWSMFESITGRVQQGAEQVRGGAAGTTEQARMRSASTKERAMDKLEDFIESLDRPALDSEAIRRDVELLFSDPKAGAGDLYERIKNLNRDDVMAMVTANKYVSREDAEKTVNRVMEVRDQIMGQAERMKLEVQRRLEQARQEMLYQADQMRKVLSSATWWVFLTALFSGGAAIVGGWVATFAPLV